MYKPSSIPADPDPAWPVRPRPLPLLFANGSDALWTCALAAVVTFALLPSFADRAGWVGLALPSAMVLLGSMASMLRHGLPLPQLAGFLALFQLTLAPWMADHFPTPAIYGYNIGDRLNAYLAFAVPASLAYALAVMLSQAGCWSARPPWGVCMPNPRLARAWGLLFAAALAVKLVRPNVPSALAFFVHLFGELSFVCVFALLIMRHPRWWVLALALYGLEWTIALQSTMYHQTLIWTAALVGLWCFTRRVRFAVALPGMLAGLLAVSVLQVVKAEQRGMETAFGARWSEDEGAAPPGVDEAGWLSAKDIGWAVLRFNQGWIVNKVMLTVPTHEPYAQGETLWQTALAAVFPRALLPEKIRAGGREYFERFTRHPLTSASMELGFAGEMYANFGLVGGIVGCAGYGLLLGLVFRWFARKASGNPLWWAWMPYVCVVGIKAEDGIGYVVNWIVKAALVAALVLFVVPVLRGAMRPLGPVPPGPPTEDDAP